MGLVMPLIELLARNCAIDGLPYATAIIICGIIGVAIALSSCIIGAIIHFVDDHGGGSLIIWALFLAYIAVSIFLIGLSFGATYHATSAYEDDIVCAIIAGVADLGILTAFYDHAKMEDCIFYL